MGAQVIKPKQTLITTQRNTTIDIMRIFAAFGVIAIHVHFNTTTGNTFQKFIAPFCVPFFFVTSLTYFASNLKESILKNTLIKSWYRTILPYLAWSFIYIILLITKSYLKAETRDINLVRMIIYGESAVHLYFLSELLFMQMMALGIYLTYKYRHKKRIIGLILIIATINYFSIGYTNNYFGVIKPLTLLVYIIFSFTISSSIKKVSSNSFHIITGLLLIIIANIVNTHNDNIFYQRLSSELPIGGIGLLLMGIGFPYIKLPHWLLNLASITFGIYLSHILFLEFIEIVIEKGSIKLPTLDFVFNLIITTIIFLLSSLFTIFCRRNHFFKKILLGEKS